MSRIATKLDAAFRYFPFGFDNFKVSGSWVQGPTFAAKVIGNDGAEDVSVLAGLGVYLKQDPTDEFKAIMNATELSDVTVDPKKHSEYCSGRTIDSSETEKIELAWALYDLAKALGVVKYKQSSLVIYGYNANDELVVLAAARMQADRCFRQKSDKGFRKKEDIRRTT